MCFGLLLALNKTYGASGLWEIIKGVFQLSKANQTCLLPYTEQEKDPKFWNAWAQQTLKNALTLQNLNQNKAKNLILFLGDGKPRRHYVYILICVKKL